MDRECDVCKLDFPSSPPNDAVADAAVGGPWAFLCEAHVESGTVGNFFEPRPCVKCKKPTKRLFAGEPRCQACR